MPRFSLFLIVALAAGQAPTLAAECFYPDGVIIPDGARSTVEEMKASEAYVREYMAAMEEYLECLEQEAVQSEAQPTTAAPESGPAGERTRQRHAAIDAMEAVAAQFNEQVRAFKKANP